MLMTGCWPSFGEIEHLGQKRQATVGDPRSARNHSATAIAGTQTVAVPRGCLAIPHGTLEGIDVSTGDFGEGAAPSGAEEADRHQA